MFCCFFLRAQLHKRYEKQLSLPSNTICVYEEDGGLLLANKVVDAYQVSASIKAAELLIQRIPSS